LDYIKEAKDLIQNLSQKMNPSPYDTAWVARLRDDNNNPRWPDLLDWLIKHQRSDGSWGGKIEYYHDRIICTLISLIALRENGLHLQTRRAIRMGEKYLWNHLHLLRRDPFELAGFELILPTLMEEARSLGLDLPSHTCGYGEIQTTKLRLIPPNLLYSPNISTVYSLEFMGKAGDISKLRQAKTNLGAIGNSPATTAYYLSLNPDKDTQALEYLETVQKHHKGIIPMYPFDTFELTWALNNLLYTDLPITKFISIDRLKKLQSKISVRGIGFGTNFTVTDGDTTSVTYRVLASVGLQPNSTGLAYFENEKTGIFRTWDFERNVSVSANAHALEALHLMSNYPNVKTVKEKIILSLLENRILNMYWSDKWHASPYYATSHALIALIREKPFLVHICDHTVEWLLHTQKYDGSWGFFGTGTLEETAYVMTVLLQINHYKPIPPDVLHIGAEYLMRGYEKQENKYPDLWIAKSLFGPHDVIRSAILAAIILYTSEFK
jgi:hypothetical protein